jgi:hypothetical protein
METWMVTAARSTMLGTGGGGGFFASGASSGGGAPGPMTVMVASGLRVACGNTSGICSTRPSVVTDPSRTGAASVPEIHTHPLAAPCPYSFAKSGNVFASKRASMLAPSDPSRALPPPLSVPFPLTIDSRSIDAARPSRSSASSIGS